MKKGAKWTVGQRIRVEGYAATKSQHSFFSRIDGPYEIGNSCIDGPYKIGKSFDSDCFDTINFLCGESIWTTHRRNVILIKTKKEKWLNFYSTAGRNSYPSPVSSIYYSSKQEAMDIGLKAPEVWLGCFKIGKLHKE